MNVLDHLPGTSLLKMNLQILFARYPQYQGRWTSIDLSSLGRFAVRKGESGGLELLENGQVIDTTKSELFSKTSEVLKAPARIILVEGFGLGSVYEFLERSSQSLEAEDYIFIEPSIERFLYIASLLKLDRLLSSPKLEWLIGESPNELALSFHRIIYKRDRIFKMRSAQFYSHPTLSPLDSDYFEAARAQWKSVCDLSEASAGYREDTMVGIRNCFENELNIRNTPGIQLLEKKFLTTPAIAIATGPSLEKSLPLLKSLQNKAILIAADASLKILLKAGISPHFVCTIERDEEAKPFFENIEVQDSMPNLVTYPLVPRAVIEAYSGPKWIAYRNQAFFGHLEAVWPRGILTCEHSVAHMCVRLADYLGCPEVTLVGQDLSFDPKNFKSHPEGIAYSDWSKPQSLEDLEKKLKEKVVWVDGNLGEKVPTYSFYLFFLREFSQLSENLSCKIQNGTQGGASIPQIPWIRLEELIDHYPQQGSLFERIASFRKNFRISAPYDFADLRTYCAQKQMELLRLREVMDQLDISDEKKISEMRSKCSELLGDPIFYSITSYILGRRFIQLENEWNQLPLATSNSDFEKRSNILKDWYLEHGDVASEMLSAVSYFAKVPENSTKLRLS